MATKTTNYEFTKPNDDDYYDIQIENRNWDRADQQLKKLEEEKADVDGGDISETKIKTFDQPTEEFPVPAAGDSVKGVLGKVKKFFEDFKAFKNGVITVGRLVNNGLTTKEGFALDARYGKTLADSIAQLNSDYHRKVQESGNTNDPVTTIKKYWAVLPDGCYCLRICCGAEYGSVMSHLDDGLHGSVLIFGYQNDFFKFVTCKNGVWNV